MSNSSEILRTLGKDVQEYFHSTTKANLSPIDRHIWLSHTPEQAKAWEKLTPNSRTFKVKLLPDTKIARSDSPGVSEALKQLGETWNDYVGDLTSNPSPKEIKNHPITKALQELGYDGVVHMDYDPRNSDKDHPVTLLFNRKKVSHDK